MYINTSNNFSFCVSEFITNRYNIAIDEHICYILGSSINLQLLLKKNSFYINDFPNLSNINNYYIECNNPLSIENFSSNINAVFRIDHNNNLKDINWIASDYLNLNNIKTLVLLSDNILSEKKSKYSKPIYAIVHFPNLSNDDINFKTLREKFISVSLMKNTSILIKSEVFFRYWKVKDNEQFNANRYVIIPPLYNDFEKCLPHIIKNSLIRQYYLLAEKDGWVGPSLIKRLIDNINYDSSDENLKKHINLLRYSLEGNKALSYYDMNRFYAAQSFQILYDKKIIKKKTIINSLESCSKSWIACYDELRRHLPKKKVIIDIYKDIYNKESMIVDSLNNIIASWI
jgi:hypothetical protein